MNTLRILILVSLVGCGSVTSSELLADADAGDVAGGGGAGGAGGRGGASSGEGGRADSAAGAGGGEAGGSGGGAVGGSGGGAIAGAGGAPAVGECDLRGELYSSTAPNACTANGAPMYLGGRACYRCKTAEGQDVATVSGGPCLGYYASQARLCVPSCGDCN